MNTALLSSIASAESLPSVPAVAFKILELCREDDVDIREVGDVIAQDPALTAKMLRVSNSSLFGMSKQVSTIEQALLVLGMRTVKIMALGFSLVDALSENGDSGFDYSCFWRRSLSAAVAARRLAEEAGDVRRDEAFVGGLLCDVGMAAAERHPQRVYDPVIMVHRARGGRLQDIEQSILGVTHAQISALMLGNWSMPEILSHAVSAHHGQGYADLEPRVQRVAAVLWAASEIAELFCGDIDAGEADTVREHVISLTKVSGDALEGVLEALNDQVRETADMFRIALAEEVSYDEIRQRAMMQLTVLSMKAEQERASAETRAREADTQLRTLSELAESLEQRACTDKLTGIANRQAFDDRLEAAIRYGTERKGDIGLLLLDLDHFKNVNDTYGHQAGDSLLRLVGRCLGKIVDETRFAARYGGEEFAVVVTDSSARQLRELAEDIRKSVGKIRCQHGSKDVGVTVSVGAAHISFAEETVDPPEIIRRADECLYDAKRDGRNRVEITF